MVSIHTTGSIININVEDGVLTWQAPSFDGGSSITDYNVRFYNQGEQNSVAVLRTTGRVWHRPSIAELPARRPVNVQVCIIKYDYDAIMYYQV